VNKENIKVIESSYGYKFKRFCTGLLRQLGQILVKFPIEINAVEISNLQGLFSGDVKLTIWEKLE
jgi:hypothetical protein